MLKRKKLRLPIEQQESKNNLCKLCDIEDWQNLEFLKLASEIMTGNIPESDTNNAIKHRKLWEFTKVIQALEQGNVITPESRGISVAAGSERLLFYLAHRIKSIIATDIYGVGDFQDKEADINFLDHTEQYAPYPYPQDKLTPLLMDGYNLAYPDNCFDFAFCLSSIEHFGGPKNSKKCIEEMVRVTKPGGVIAYTTECSLNGGTFKETFSPKELVEISNLETAEMIEEPNWYLSEDSLEYLIDMKHDDLDTVPHINLKTKFTIFTSISIALKKKGHGERALSDQEFQELTNTHQKSRKPVLDNKVNNIFQRAVRSTIRHIENFQYQ